MDPVAKIILQSRRDFLTSSAGGLGGIALTAALAREGLLEAAASRGLIHPNAPKAPHFAPKAKACIFLFMAGEVMIASCGLCCFGKPLPVIH